MFDFSEDKGRDKSITDYGGAVLYIEVLRLCYCRSREYK